MKAINTNKTTSLDEIEQEVCGEVEDSNCFVPGSFASSIGMSDDCTSQSMSLIRSDALSVVLEEEEEKSYPPVCPRRQNSADFLDITLGMP